MLLASTHVYLTLGTCGEANAIQLADVDSRLRCRSRLSIPDSRQACTCNAGYSGASCELTDCPGDCNAARVPPAGACSTDTGACACNTGYGGEDCSACAPGYETKTTMFGVSCVRVATPLVCPGTPSPCTGHGECDSGTGTCACTLPHAGSDCSSTPPPPPPAPSPAPAGGEGQGQGQGGTGTAAPGEGGQGGQDGGGGDDAGVGGPVSASVPVLLVSGVPHSATTVAAKDTAYFVLDGVSTEHGVEVVVVPSSGDPDVYVSSADTTPSRTRYVVV